MSNAAAALLLALPASQDALVGIVTTGALRVSSP
jgi:hypothetical protein